ncbi:glycosyltransferase family 4 protein [Hydrogenophaga atypica]|uniref:Glycosyltransferase family 4 protein n=1 Tax=Hydrogenophaga atypica TaxID=249409 RepID=A0ABW2QG45_9BURK
MKIIFLLPPVNFSGGIRVISIYAQWLAQHGHEVLLLSPPPKPVPFRRALKSWMRGRGWPQKMRVVPSHIDGKGLNHLVLDCHRPPNINDIPRADVIVATWWETAEWLNSFPDNWGSKTYFIQGYEVFDYLPRNRCEATYRFPFKKIVVAQWLADLMREKYGDPNVEVVVNGVDHELFYSPIREKQCRPTMGVLYHEAHLKGFDVALSTISRLKARIPDLGVIAFGSRAPSGVYDIPDYFDLHIAPAQERLRELYSSCDVWLTTSRSEGFNLMAVEAMACRTPVVSSRTGWPYGAVVDGKNGYLFDIDDVLAAEDALYKILNLPNQSWKTMSDSAFSTASEISWESSCLKFESALKKAVA